MWPVTRSQGEVLEFWGSRRIELWFFRGSWYMHCWHSTARRPYCIPLIVVFSNNIVVFLNRYVMHILPSIL
jgi:hypothetical protein